MMQGKVWDLLVLRCITARLLLTDHMERLCMCCVVHGMLSLWTEATAALLISVSQQAKEPANAGIHAHNNCPVNVCLSQHMVFAALPALLHSLIGVHCTLCSKLPLLQHGS